MNEIYLAEGSLPLSCVELLLSVLVVIKVLTILLCPVHTYSGFFSSLVFRPLVSFAAVLWSRHATRWGGSALRDETKTRPRRRLFVHTYPVNTVTINESFWRKRRFAVFLWTAENELFWFKKFLTYELFFRIFLK